VEQTKEGLVKIPGIFVCMLDS